MRYYPLDPYLNTTFVIPKRILNNAIKKIPLLRFGDRVVLANYSTLGVILKQKGFFDHIHLLGAIEWDKRRVGRNFYGIRIFSYKDLKRLALDAIIIVDVGRRVEIMNSILSTIDGSGINLIDLCEGYDSREARSEVSAQLNQINLIPLNSDVVIRMPMWGLGDMICALSAARKFARDNPQFRVHFNRIPSILRSYRDKLVTTGGGQIIDISQHGVPYFFNEETTSFAMNYLGCYYLSLGMDFDNPPELELPSFLPPKGLSPGRYIVIQPRAASEWGGVPLSVRTLQNIVNNCPLPVVCVGKRGTDLMLQNMDCSYMGNELSLLQLIQHCALVIAPRSVSAHIAAGYHRPAVIIVPDDAFNWHLDYSHWHHVRVPDNTYAIDKVVISNVHRLIGISERRFISLGESPILKRFALECHFFIAEAIDLCYRIKILFIKYAGKGLILIRLCRNLIFARYKCISCDRIP